jgi:hypothetical protein
VCNRSHGIFHSSSLILDMPVDKLDVWNDDRVQRRSAFLNGRTYGTCINFASTSPLRLTSRSPSSTDCHSPLIIPFLISQTFPDISGRVPSWGAERRAQENTLSGESRAGFHASECGSRAQTRSMASPTFQWDGGTRSQCFCKWASASWLRIAWVMEERCASHFFRVKFHNGMRAKHINRMHHRTR